MAHLKKPTDDVAHAKIAPVGRIVIPAPIRRELGVGVGDELLLRIAGGELRVSSRKQALKALQQRVRQLTKGKPSLTDELIAERRLEAARE